MSTTSRNGRRELNTLRERERERERVERHRVEREIDLE